MGDVDLKALEKKYGGKYIALLGQVSAGLSTKFNFQETRIMAAYLFARIGCQSWNHQGE